MAKSPKKRRATKKHTGTKVTAPSLTKPGRRKRKFTLEEKVMIKQMALDNCHLDTIALALGIPKQTLADNFRSFIRQKRAEGRCDLRRTQRVLSKTHTAMAIFLGKNELEQKDVRDYNLSGEVILKPPTVR